MALRQPDVDVVGIGVVAGNVPLDLAVQNALYVAELCAVDVPVHAGADRPLVLPLATGQHVHGTDGMGDIGLPLTGRSPTPGHAVDALLDASTATPGPHARDPRAAHQHRPRPAPRPDLAAARIERCVVMGAVADHVGNQTPVAEFNMWVDPHAVAVVLRVRAAAGARRLGHLPPSCGHLPGRGVALRAIGTPLAELCVDIQRVLDQFCQEETKLAGFDLPTRSRWPTPSTRRVATETRRLSTAPSRATARSPEAWS